MIRPYYDTARSEVVDYQGLAEASYFVARSAIGRGDLRLAVGHQRAARINHAAARAAYDTWMEGR
jgi:hypothetical protein